jgi:predicted RNA-binding Zn ribbon-like protein
MTSGGRSLESDPHEMILLPPLTGVIELTGYLGEHFLPDLAAPSFLLGGRLAIDFANIPSYSGAPAQHLSWEELIVFLQASGIVSAERGSSLLALSGSDPDAAQTLLSRSLRLRDALRMAFAAMVKKDAIAREWTEPINEILRITEGHDELVSDGIAWKMEFVARESGLDWLLAAIARSAAEIIVEGAQARLRVCANARCGLFFCDDSRTHRRRWCSMAVCGNRHKVASFARRHSA